MEPCIHYLYSSPASCDRKSANLSFRCTGFFWGGTCFITLIWAFFRMPETKHRTYEELDILFARGTPARKFKTAKIDELD